MFRTLLLLILLSTPFLTFAATPGTVEYFVHNSSNGKPFAVGRVPNHPWPATTSSPPFTFGTMTKPIGSTKLPTYMPQRITPASFARGMFNAIVRGHPVAKAAVVGWAVYECATAESGLCAGGGDTDPFCSDGGTLTNQNGLFVCAVEPSNSPWVATIGSGTFTATADSQSDAYNAVCNQYAAVQTSSESQRTWRVRVPTEYQSCRIESWRSIKLQDGSWSPGSMQTVSNIPVVVTQTNGTFCPPSSHPTFTNIGGTEPNQYCWKLADTPDPEPVRDVTLDDLRDWMAQNPYIFDNLPDDVLKDHNTGKPDDTFFDKPKHTPISPPLSDAFESLGTGLAQDTNPSAPHYIPPELKPEVEQARDKMHNGEPFVDPFTNTTVTPDPAPSDPDPYTPPSEVVVNLDGLNVNVEVDMNWDDFPGLTQEQYEQSNDKLATSFDSVEMPDIQGSDSDFLDSVGQNPDLPFSPFDFGTLWPVTGGQCTGFAVTMSIRGDTKSVMMDKHCPPYNEWAHPLIAWFLQLLCALHIFHLFSRMISAG